MLKQLIDVKSNKIFVLQTVGKGTSCPACVWQTDLHTAQQQCVSQHSTLSLRMTAIYLYGSHIVFLRGGGEKSGFDVN